jgi:hypothetical protein
LKEREGERGREREREGERGREDYASKQRGRELEQEVDGERG